MNQPDHAALMKVTKARTALLIEQPFFGTLAMRLKLVPDNRPENPTLYVDGKVIGYNEKFVNGLSHPLAMSAMAHEVMHCVLDHVGEEARGKGLDHDKFNRAGDYVINAMLKSAGMTIGDGWLYDAAFNGMTTEQVYKLLPDTPKSGGGGGPGPGQPGGSLDQVRAGTKDPAMAQQQATDWKVAAVQSANAAAAVGKLHGDLNRFVEGLMENKVDWRDQLRRFVQQSSKDDYSWARPSRKMLAAGYYLPGLHSEAMGPIVIASDESGSVSDKILAAFSAEISAIRQDMRPSKVTVAHFAVNVGAVDEFLPDDSFELVRKCDGGTDFRPVMQFAEELAEKPICMIYLTDLYGPFPKDPPPFPVLWVCINKQVAPFGETIHIDID